MKRFLPILFIAALCCSSCSNKTLIDESHTFAHDTWLRFEPEKFQVRASSTDDCYDIYITLQVDTCQFKARELPLAVNIYSSDEERRMFPTTLVLRDSQGGWQGTFEGSLLTVTKNVRPYFFFNKKDTYRVELSQTTHYYEVHGIRSIALRFEESELEFPE